MIELREVSTFRQRKFLAELVILTLVTTFVTAAAGVVTLANYLAQLGG